ncbi:hypothetical protein CHS0354_038384 [Potamilus streckersoni]|uniref:Uncharacterized protein n=1 Tax=Potamilus streckersoni TaxID=2493646 RepID=A0AAE0VPW5_9BIVA|nr:hypothetical protein CHS0354_038384 [Potamilus streckersoni]
MNCFSMGATRPISLLLFLCCSFWSILFVHCDTKTVTIMADSDCVNGGQTLEDDDEMNIKYNGDMVYNCELPIKAEHKLGKDDDKIICFEAIRFDVSCSVVVQYRDQTDAFSFYTRNKTYSCDTELPPVWCSSGTSAFLHIKAQESSLSKVHIKVYVVERDEAFIEIANKAVVAIGVVIGIVVGVIVLGVIIVIIIICCCCKRRGSRGNVYRQPQHAAAMTVVHTPISQPSPPTQPSYYNQQPGYGPQTTLDNYPVGSQPPPTSYPMYPPQQQGFMVNPPMQNQMPTATPVPDPFTKKGDPTAQPPQNDLPPPYPVDLNNFLTCSRRKEVEDDDTLYINFEGLIAGGQSSCEIKLEAEQKFFSSYRLCVEAVTYYVSCTTKVKYYDGMFSGIPSQTYSCKSLPSRWCSTQKYIVIKVESSGTEKQNVLLKVYSTKIYGSGSGEIGHVAGTATLGIAVVVGIVIASIVGTIILIVLIVCCCCKRRSTRGNVNRHFQEATPMTSMQPTSQAAFYPQPVVYGAPPQGVYYPPPQVSGQGYPPYMGYGMGAGGGGGSMEAGPLPKKTEPTAPLMGSQPPPYPGS